MDRYIPPELQQEMKSFSEITKEIFADYVDQMGVSELVELRISKTPLTGEGSGQLVERWSKDQKAVLAIYESPDINERKESRKGLDFLIGHELMHCFDNVVDKFSSQLSDEENVESLSFEQMNNPLFISGQTETFVDFMALRSFSDNDQKKTKMVEGYNALIKSFLKYHDSFLRDEIRALSIVKIMPELKITVTEELQKTAELLLDRVNKEKTNLSDAENKYIDLYEARLDALLKDCTNISSEDWGKILKAEIPGL